MQINLYWIAICLLLIPTFFCRTLRILRKQMVREIDSNGIIIIWDYKTLLFHKSLISFCMIFEFLNDVLFAIKWTERHSDFFFCMGRKALSLYFSKISMYWRFSILDVNTCVWLGISKQIKEKVLNTIFTYRCNSRHSQSLKTMQSNVCKTFERVFENLMTITDHFIVAIPFTRKSKRQWLLFFYVFINIMM